MLNVLAQKYDKTPKPELETRMVHPVFTVYLYTHIYTHVQYVQLTVLHKFIVCLLFIVSLTEGNGSA